MFEKSKWIWCKKASETNAYVDFCQFFTACGNREKAFLHISCANQYAAFLNGRMIGTGQYADLPEHRIFQSHAVETALIKGKNILEIRVFYQGIDTLVWQRGKPGLIYELTEDDMTRCVSDETVVCAPVSAYEKDVPLITLQMGFSFVYHASLDRTDGENRLPADPVPEYYSAAVLTDIREMPEKRPIPALILEQPYDMRVYTQGIFSVERKPGSIEKLIIPKASGLVCQRAALSYRCREELFGNNTAVMLPGQKSLKIRGAGGDGVYLILAAEDNLCGLLSLDLEVAEGTRIDISWGEHLDDLRVRSSIEDRSFCATYYARAGRQRYIHWFRRIGARYIQLFIYAPEADLFYAGIQPVTYPVDKRPYLICKDYLHAMIYETAKKTLHNCMHEHYEDCPWREQSLYVVDSRMQMLSAYYAFGEYALSRESIRLMGLTMREDGLVAMCAPGKFSNGLDIPSFAYNWPSQLAEYVLYSGDLEFGKEMLPVAEQLCSKALERRSSNGLVPIYKDSEYFNFYEWKEGLDGGDPFSDKIQPVRFDFILNGYLVMALHSIIQLREWLGMPAFEQWDTERRELMENMGRFWDSKKQVYAAYLDDNGVLSVYAELTQAVAILSGVCPECQAANLAEKLWRSDDLIRTTLSFCFFRYEALLKTSDKWLSAIMDEIARRWGKMLFAGCKTFWETDLGEEDFNGAGSLCHGWAAIPIYFYFAYGAGIRPVSPGKWMFSGIGQDCAGLFDRAATVAGTQYMEWNLER